MSNSIAVLWHLTIFHLPYMQNSVNLLESVLPLSKKVRSRKKVYEDALDLTSVLEESLFYLVNRLRKYLLQYSRSSTSII